MSIRTGAEGEALIGPNAILQMVEALRGLISDGALRALFERAGIAAYLDEPPQAMLPDLHVQRLHAVLRQSMAERDWRATCRNAGLRTADYLLANRIPAAAQRVLRWLPDAWAAALLSRAIEAHAWTFAGAGQFQWTAGKGVLQYTLRGNPVCRGASFDSPVCDYYAATFERLFQVLVSAQTRVSEPACEAVGSTECRFEIRLRPDR